MPNRSLFLTILALLASPIVSSHALAGEGDLEQVFKNAKKPTLADVQKGRWSCSVPGSGPDGQQVLAFKEVIGSTVSLDWNYSYRIPLTKDGLKNTHSEIRFPYMFYTFELRTISLGNKKDENEKIWIIRDETLNSATKEKWVTIRTCEKIDESALTYISPFLASAFAHKGQTVNPDGTVTVDWPTYRGTYLTYAPETLFLTPVIIKAPHLVLSEIERDALYNNTPRFAAGYICRSLGFSDLTYYITESNKGSAITSSEEKYLSTYNIDTLEHNGSKMIGFINIQMKQNRHAISSIRCMPRD